MPRIEFVKDRPAIIVERGANLMRALLDNGLPVASSCHGQAVCSKCRIQIVAGAENLTPQNEFERTLRERLHIDPELRISCQTQVNGDVVIDTPYW
jgi:2Fe-2S ferredoxin